MSRAVHTLLALGGFALLACSPDSTPDPRTTPPDRFAEHLARALTGQRLDCRGEPEVMGRCKTKTSGRPADVLLLRYDKNRAEAEQLMSDPVFLQRWDLGKPVAEPWVIGDVIAVDRADWDRPSFDVADTAGGGDATRPSPIGKSVGPAKRSTNGTLGCRVIDSSSGQRYLLSNAHVLNPRQRFQKEHPIIQPSRSEGGRCKTDTVGLLDDWRSVDFEKRNPMDAAIALTEPGCVDSSTDGRYGYPSASVRWAEHELAVKKVGGATDYREGRVRCVSADLCVRYGGNHAELYDQIVIDQTPGTKPAPFCRKGDSGSLVVTKEGNHPVALLFAYAKLRRTRSGDIVDACIATPIQRVLDEFNVDVDATKPSQHGCNLRPTCP